MNGLDMLNTAPGGASAGPAVAAKAGDAGSDDPGGDTSRSFNALLAAFDEPAAAAPEGPVRPAIPAFATPPSAVLRQTLQVVSEIVPGNAAETVVELPAQAADGAPAAKK